MSKPVGYYSLSLENPLINDIAETWGESLEDVTEVDTYWMVARLGIAAFMQSPDNAPPSDEAQEVIIRCEELDGFEKYYLMKALANNNGKPIGYWSLSLKNSLIKDICQTWGENLERLTETDRVWLTGKIAHEAWCELGDEIQSDEASDVFHRLHEISYSEKTRLIQALINS